MKKTYLPPETEILSLVNESMFVCASADDLTLNKTYVNTYDEDDFWD